MRGLTESSTSEKKKPLLPRLGAHLSVKGGVSQAILRCREIGAECLQIFTRSPRVWNSPKLTDEEVAKFRNYADRYEIFPIIAHAIYLPNIASNDKTIRKKTVKSLISEWNRSYRLGLSDLILHPGSHRGIGEKKGLRLAAEVLDEVFNQIPEKGPLITLETTAGHGYSLGGKLSHFNSIMAHSRYPERLGICLDTCHVFVAGYDITTRDGIEKILGEIGSQIGMDKIRAVHVNDSKRELGSHIDRHEHIGRGYLGCNTFYLLLCNSKLKNLPFLLETPKEKSCLGVNMDKINLRILKYLRKKAHMSGGLNA
ncbi:MAG: deoxyribonuclease IV [Candidatus Eremiobacteraeota bacterium]|nr:deoxyribonuclease IV [Candidatus Eremiobacteraeota bacterium]